jgi:hypothetical protein
VRRRAAVAAGLGLAVVVAALLAVLTQSTSRVAFHNGRFVQTGVVVPPRHEACQVAEYVPADARRLRIWVSTAGRLGPPLELVVKDPTHVVATGETLTPYRDSPVDLRVSPLRRDVTDATVCLRDRGTSQVAVMGSPTSPNAGPGQTSRFAGYQVALSSQAPAATLDAHAYSPPLRMRLEWHMAGRQSWLSLAPVIARRTSYERASFVGAWTFWVLVAIMAAAAVGGVTLYVRETPA